MKKHFTAAISLILFFLNGNIGAAQNTACTQLQEKIDKFQEKLTRIEVRKFTYEDFFSLMDNPNSLTETSIPEEIANAEYRIRGLQRKISEGDNSPETAAELKNYQSRIKLLNIRGSRIYDKNTFFKDPSYLEQERTFNKLKSEELALKLDIAGIENSMKENNCVLQKKKSDDMEDIDDEIIEKPKDEKGKEVIIDKPKVGTTDNHLDLKNFLGSWKSYPDKNSIVSLNLTQTSSKISGSGMHITKKTAIIDGSDFNTKYDIKGCVEEGRKLRCDFTGLVDNEQMRMEMAGVVYLTLSGEVLGTSFKEMVPAKISNKITKRSSKGEELNNWIYNFIKE